jgi:hypothetical protein
MGKKETSKYPIFLPNCAKLLGVKDLKKREEWTGH